MTEKNNDMKHPHIILITSHDSGNCFSFLGFPMQTPNIDEFAKTGVQFLNHFASAPQCSPSRGSILTGKMPHVNGLMGLTNRGWDLPTSNQTIPKILGEHGYSTHLIGLQHCHKDALALGYDSVSPRREAPFFGKTVEKRLRKFLKNKDFSDRPNYLEIGLLETHRPFLRGIFQRLNSKEIIVPKYLPDTAGTRKDLSKFSGMLNELDKRVGNIIEIIRSQPDLKDALVIFTNDHGWAFPRAKCTLYDPGLHTTLILSWPNHINPGDKYSGLSSNVDLLPTLLDLIGLPHAQNDQKDQIVQNIDSIQGRSLKNEILPLNQSSTSSRNEIFAELTHHDSGFNGMRCIRTDKWKYIYNFNSIGDKLFEIPRDIRWQPSAKSYYKNNPDYFSERPTEELYSLKDDPNEFENIAQQEQFQEIKDSLKERLFQFLKDTNDPILNGEIPAPQLSRLKKTSDKISDRLIY